MKFIIIVIVILSSYPFSAQTLQIEYLYRENVDLSEFKEQFPDQVVNAIFRSNESIHYIKNYYLWIGSNKSIFEPKDSIPQDIELPYDGGVIKIHSIEYQTKFFVDNVRNILIGEIPYRGKMMNIQDTIPDLCWEITNERKTVLGYPVTKAEVKFCNRSIKAWFTTDIPAQAGPLFYGGLPGLILELSIDNDFKHYQAINILNDTKNDCIIKEEEHSITEHLKLSDYCTH